jgi:hypothetical protein
MTWLNPQGANSSTRDSVTVNDQVSAAWGLHENNLRPHHDEANEDLRGRWHQDQPELRSDNHILRRGSSHYRERQAAPPTVYPVPMHALALGAWAQIRERHDWQGNSAVDLIDNNIHEWSDDCETSVAIKEKRGDVVMSMNNKFKK